MSSLNMFPFKQRWKNWLAAFALAAALAIIPQVFIGSSEATRASARGEPFPFLADEAGQWMLWSFFTPVIWVVLMILLRFRSGSD